MKLSFRFGGGDEGKRIYLHEFFFVFVPHIQKSFSFICFSGLIIFLISLSSQTISLNMSQKKTLEISSSSSSSRIKKTKNRNFRNQNHHFLSLSLVIVNGSFFQFFRYFFFFSDGIKFIIRKKMQKNRFGRRIDSRINNKLMAKKKEKVPSAIVVVMEFLPLFFWPKKTKNFF